MREIFIIHGSYGNPDENWFPWLKKELESNSHHVIIPQFPIPASEEQNAAWGGHNLQKWLDVLKQHEDKIDENTIFVAHSRGCIFLYHYLATRSTPIAGAFLVAPWLKFRWYPEGWKETDSFHKLPFEWEKIKKGCNNFWVYQSTNDDTPVSEGGEIANKLQAKLVVVENAGHFNTSSGYNRFPQLLEDILEYTNK